MMIEYLYELSVVKLKVRMILKSLNAIFIFQLKSYGEINVNHLRQ